MTVSVSFALLLCSVIQACTQRCLDKWGQARTPLKWMPRPLYWGPFGSRTFPKMTAQDAPSTLPAPMESAQGLMGADAPIFNDSPVGQAAPNGQLDSGMDLINLAKFFTAIRQDAAQRHARIFFPCSPQSSTTPVRQ